MRLSEQSEEELEILRERRERRERGQRRLEAGAHYSGYATLMVSFGTFVFMAETDFQFFVQRIGMVIWCAIFALIWASFRWALARRRKRDAAEEEAIQ